MEEDVVGERGAVDPECWPQRWKKKRKSLNDFFNQTPDLKSDAFRKCPVATF